MIRTPARFAAIALSALMSLGIVGALNGIATAQYSAADDLAMSAQAGMHVAVQHVSVVGHRATA